MLGAWLLNAATVARAILERRALFVVVYSAHAVFAATEWGFAESNVDSLRNLQ